MARRRGRRFSGCSDLPLAVVLVNDAGVESGKELPHSSRPLLAIDAVAEHQLRLRRGIPFDDVDAEPSLELERPRGRASGSDRDRSPAGCRTSRSPTIEPRR
jgi:hypothetical protein